MSVLVGAAIRGNVTVGVAVWVDVAVGVAVWVDVAVGVAVWVDVAVGVAVWVDVAVGVGVCVSVGVFSTVGPTSSVAVAGLGVAGATSIVGIGVSSAFCTKVLTATTRVPTMPGPLLRVGLGELPIIAARLFGLKINTPITLTANEAAPKNPTVCIRELARAPLTGAVLPYRDLYRFRIATEALSKRLESIAALISPSTAFSGERFCTKILLSRSSLMAL